MHIRNYEIPDGRSKGEPEVLVTRSVIDRLGLPDVNYTGLHQFFTDDLGVPYGEPTTIKLFGGFSGLGLHLGGFHFPYTRTIHVNAPFAESMFPFAGGGDARSGARG